MILSPGWCWVPEVVENDRSLRAFAAIYSPVTLSLSIVACLRVMNVRHDNLILIYLVS